MGEEPESPGTGTRPGRGRWAPPAALAGAGAALGAAAAMGSTGRGITPLLAVTAGLAAAGLAVRSLSDTARRSLIPWICLPAIVGMVVYTIPSSSATGRAIPPWMLHTYEAMGLHQKWGMFAPDPPTETVDIRARVAFADGTVLTVGQPVGDIGLGAVYHERWRKWSERVRPPDARVVWPFVAIWFARTHQDSEGGRHGEVVTVSLVRHWVDTVLPDAAPTRGEHEFEFFRLDLKTGAGTYLDPELAGQAAPKVIIPRDLRVGGEEP